jgi:excisionase family DNA binding protein
MTLSPKSSGDREFFSVAELAELAGVNHKAIRRAIERGELRAEKLFNRVRIPAAEWERYRASRQVAHVPRSALGRAATSERRRSEPGSLARLRAIEEGEAA